MREVSGDDGEGEGDALGHLGELLPQPQRVVLLSGLGFGLLRVFFIVSFNHSGETFVIEGR